MSELCCCTVSVVEDVCGSPSLSVCSDMSVVWYPPLSVITEWSSVDESLTVLRSLFIEEDMIYSVVGDW